MKPQDAHGALDDAFTDGLKKLFEMLVLNSESEGVDQAIKQFARGVNYLDEAHARASAVIETIFKD